MKQFIQIFFVWAFLLAPLYPQTAEWQQTGPVGGDVNALVATDAGQLIAGTRLGGLFRSTDDGQNWTHLEESRSAPFLFNGVWDLLKNSQGHLFAATNQGVYRSTDNGVSWTAFDAGLTNRFIRALIINSTGILFAASNSAGIFRSEDNGESWTGFNNGLTILNVRSLAINSLGDVFAGTTDGIFISSDNGDNWTEVSNGLGNKLIFSIFVTPEDSLLAGNSNGAFRSSDHGANWTQIIQFSSIRSFASNSSNVLFAGGGGGFFFRSFDNGLTWETAGDQLVFAAFEDIFVLPSEGLLAATANYGVVHSSDNGDTWAQQNARLTTVDVVDMTQTPSGTIFVGTSDGIFRTNDGGDNWNRTIQDTIGLNVRFIASNASGRLFAGYGGFLTISDDNGDSWFIADSSFTVFFPNSIAFGSGNDVYVGIRGQIFKSMDSGDTWAELTTPIPSTTIQAMGVSGAGTVFAGTQLNGVYRSTDAGSTWVEVNTGIGKNFRITSFLFQPNGDVLLSSFDGVFRSSDNGDSWENTGSVPVLGVNDLVRDSRGNLFIGMRGGGVAVSEDDGATWTSINSGLWHKDADALLIDEMENIFVGTRGGSVFKAQFFPTSVAQAQSRLPKIFILKQNYPNPFNPSTQIFYSLVKASEVDLTIYNIEGQKIRTLVNEFQTSGEKSIAWNGLDERLVPVASGAYFFQIKAGVFQETKKMILLR